MSSMSFATDIEPAILIYAPDRDGALSCKLLGADGQPCARCHSEEEVMRRLHDGTALSLLLAEEFLTDSLAARLRQFVQSQPAWSDFPFLIVARQGNRAHLKALAALGNVSIMTRPMSPEALCSLARATLRARGRQLEVRALLEEQAEQSRRKDDFLAMLAHELRNPLAPIRYAAHALSLPSLPPARVPEIAMLVERQLGHMSKIIDQLLEVSRLTRGMVKIDRQPLDLSQLVRNVVEQRKPVAAARKVTLSSDIVAPVSVDGDHTRLTQVLDNLIDNAIKFSPQHSTVRIHLEADRDSALLRVVDAGDGIEAAVLPQLFEPFTQADRSLDRSQGGLGLGLAVVKALTQLHDGEVRAYSDGPGRGSVFSVRLPLAARREAVQERSQKPQRPVQARRVLIAEDNHDAAESLRLILEMSGYEVTVAHCGSTALDRARQIRPDVLVCDIGLPGMNGYEVVRALRSEPEWLSTLMIAVTGYGGEENRNEAVSAGFNAHFSKPVDPAALLAALDGFSRD